MSLPSFISHLNLKDRRDVYIALTAPVIGYIALRTAANIFSSITATHTRSKQPDVLHSPRKSLQLLSAQDLSAIPYPPDALPGARDVSTPYGNIRAYEFGPEDGRKVLFVHGISTPCIAFASIAKLLAEKHGCRVMLFDLWGRGYSDAPNPEVWRQDVALFSTQMLMVMGSSGLAWTGGNDGFTLVGYSLGGGVAGAFTRFFPELVGSLVLVAPGGLIRPQHFSGSSKLLYGGLLPKVVTEYLIYRRIKGGNAIPKRSKAAKSSLPQPGEKIAPADAAEAEVPDHPAHANDSLAAIFPGRPNISPANTVSWQVDAHPGFLPSFISSIKHAPVTNEHERWRLIGRRLSAQRASPNPEAQKQGLREGKVLVLLGKTDAVIVPDETAEDAKGALGEENVRVVEVEGAHDVPIVNPEGCVRAMVEFWDEGESKSV
jgi:pimeloyl-ACP methyl ester carboxylesterase